MAQTSDSLKLAAQVRDDVVYRRGRDAQVIVAQWEAAAPHLRRPQLFVLRPPTSLGTHSDSSLVEALNSHSHLECLAGHRHLALDDARDKINT